MLGWDRNPLVDCWFERIVSKIVSRHQDQGLLPNQHHIRRSSCIDSKPGLLVVLEGTFLMVGLRLASRLHTPNSSSSQRCRKHRGVGFCSSLWPVRGQRHVLHPDLFSDTDLVCYKNTTSRKNGKLNGQKKADVNKFGNSESRHPETQIPSSPRRQMHAVRGLTQPPKTPSRFGKACNRC